MPIWPSGTFTQYRNGLGFLVGRPDRTGLSVLPFKDDCDEAATMARRNPRRNISRIETLSAAGNVCGGWEVRIQRRGKKTEKFFSDSGYGGKRASLCAAKEFRDEIEDRSRKYSVKELATEPSVRNRSGVVGVRLHLQKDVRGDFIYQYWYWVAQWTDGHGRRKTRSFSCHTYGDEEAFSLACESRRKGVNLAKR